MENKYLDIYEKAKEARKSAYTPYSKFNVGACLKTKDNKYYVGFNIENASYSLCMCAERNAIYNAYINGVKKGDITSLCVCADTAGVVSPCGACRQVMAELLDENCTIVLANTKGKLEEYTVKDLLPYYFKGSDMNV